MKNKRQRKVSFLVENKKQKNKKKLKTTTPQNGRAKATIAVQEL